MNETLTTRESPGIDEPAYYQKMPRSSALEKGGGRSAPRQSALVPRASFLGVPRTPLEVAAFGVPSFLERTPLPAFGVPSFPKRTPLPAFGVPSTASFPRREYLAARNLMA